MNSKLIAFIAFLCILKHDSFAQPNTVAMKLGDLSPEIVFPEMVNYPTKTAKLSDFKGKLVILDFWNIACAPCIRAFPKMELIQKKYADRVQILLVNCLNTTSELDRFGFPANTKSPIISKVKLPFVLARQEAELPDVEIGNLFPHENEPFHVWISEEGKVIAMTQGAATTDKTVTDYLEKGIVNFAVQKTGEDFGIVFGNEHKSIFRPENADVFEPLQYSSIITGNLYAPKMAGHIIDSASGKLIGYRCSGNILSLFALHAMQLNPEFLANNRVILEVDDRNKFLRPVDTDLQYEWDRKNIFYYEIKLPPGRMSGDYETDLKTLRKFLKNDLERFFGLIATVEKRKVKSLAVVRTDSKKLKTTNGDLACELDGKGGMILKSGPFNLFTIFLATYNSDHSNFLPVVDKTGIKPEDKFDLRIEPFANLDELRKQLKNNYGLDLIETEEEMEVLIIKQINTNAKKPNYLVSPATGGDQ